MSYIDSTLNVANGVLATHTEAMKVEGGKYEQMRSLLVTVRLLCDDECIDFESLIWSSGSEYDNKKNKTEG